MTAEQLREIIKKDLKSKHFTAKVRVKRSRGHNYVEKFHLVKGTSETDAKDKLVKFYKDKDYPGLSHDIIVDDIEEEIN
jgi:hypothetical protein